MDTNKPKNNRGLRRLYNATVWSMQGFRSAFRNEEAFRQELLLLVILGPLGYILGESGTERAVLIGSLFILLIVELLNSAVEAVVDRIGPEHHELSGRAKDMGSAAVFVAVMLTIMIWLLVLIG